MKIIVLFFIGGAFALLVAVGAYSIYCGMRRVFGGKSDDCFDKGAKY